MAPGALEALAITWRYLTRRGAAVLMTLGIDPATTGALALLDGEGSRSSSRRRVTLGALQMLELEQLPLRGVRRVRSAAERCAPRCVPLVPV